VNHSINRNKLDLCKALAYIYNGQYATAYKLLKKYVEYTKNDAYAHYCLGRAYYGLKDYAQAINEYRRVLEISPDHINAHLHLAQTYMLSEQFAQVEKILRHLLDKYPRLAEAHFGLGKCLEKQNRNDEALKHVNVAIDIAPKVGPYHLTAGNLYRNLYQNEQALEHLVLACKLMPDSGDAFFSLGIVLNSMERYSEAVVRLEKAISLDKRTSKVYYNLGLAYSKIEDFSRSIEAFKKALELNPKDINFHYEIGILYYRIGKFEEAKGELEKFLESSPTDNRAKYYLGLSKRCLNERKEQAIELLNVMAENVPEAYKIYYQAAESLQDSDYAESINLLTEASIRVQPSQKGDFFRDASMQFFGSKAAFLGMALEEEREYSANVEKSFFQMMKTLALIADMRDSYCQTHSQRVAIIADVLAQALELDEELKNGIHIGACLHDIGKIALPDIAMYYSESKKEPELDEIYEQHTVIAADHFVSMPFPQGVIDAMRSHHECWNGSGFPEHLSGESIPLSAQIVSMADFIERLLTKGIEGQLFQPKQVIEMVQKNSDILFSPKLVKIFLNNADEIFKKLLNSI
ncbi:tetratricopeptide repeat protein, partial [bacterium]|nr:tetratricopeptide repeat protein [bacterium]